MLFKNISDEPKQILSSMNYVLVNPGHVVQISDRDLRHAGNNMRFFHQVVEVYQAVKVKDAPATAKLPEVEIPVVKEPVKEESKVEEPKVEEPKVEEPKVEEPKVEEPKVEEPKVEEKSEVKESTKTTLEKDLESNEKVLATESEER